MTGKAMVLTGSTTGAAQAEEMNVIEKGTKRVLILWRSFLNVSVLQIHLSTMHVHLKNHKNFDGAQKSKFIILKILYLCSNQCHFLLFRDRTSSGYKRKHVEHEGRYR